MTMMTERTSVFNDLTSVHHMIEDHLPHGTSVFDVSIPLIEGHPAIGIKSEADEVIGGTLKRLPAGR